MSQSLPRVAVIGAGSSGIAAAQDARRAGLRRHLLRGLGPRRRQLGLREHQRHVGVLPRPAHQHLAPADGVLGLPDAGVLPGLPAPRPDRRLLRRLRRRTSACATGSASRPRRARRAATPTGPGRISASRRHDRALRRAARRQRPPLGPALARAGVPRDRTLPGRADARPRVHEPRLPARQGRRRARHGQQRDGHRRRVLLRRDEHVPRGAPRRVHRPEVHVRQAHRPARPWTNPRIPFKIRQKVIAQARRTRTSATPTKFGLPKPDHQFGEAHPTVSGRILDRITHGAVQVKPNIRRLDGDMVEFEDGTRVHADVVVYCTGYKITLPVLRRGLHRRAGQPDRAVPPRLPPGLSRTSSSSACCSRSAR